MAEITRKMGDWLRELLEYNPETGEFFWLSDSGTAKTGDLAGVIYKNGYRYMQIYGRDYRAGRLAWFFATGEDPKAFVDHKNGIRDDNRFDNLRLASNSQNQANATWSTNTSGFKGVSWSKLEKKWTAKITVDGKARRIGAFYSIVDAALAYRREAIEVWGEFAKVMSPEEIRARAAELGYAEPVTVQDLSLFTGTNWKALYEETR